MAMDPLDKFKREVSKKSTQDFTNAMIPFSQMGSQLSAAPLCLAILGQVNLIATGITFTKPITILLTIILSILHSILLTILLTILLSIFNLFADHPSGKITFGPEGQFW